MSEQEAELGSIPETQSEKARELMDGARAGDREAMQALKPKTQELQEATVAQVEALLTEEQIPAYDKIQAEIQEMRRKGMQQRPPQ